MCRQRPLFAVAQDVDAEQRCVVDRAATVAGGVALTGDHPQVADSDEMPHVAPGRPFRRQVPDRGVAGLDPVEAAGRDLEPDGPGVIVARAGRLPVEFRRDRGTGRLVHDADVDHTRARILGVADPPAAKADDPDATVVLLDDLPVRRPVLDDRADLVRRHGLFLSGPADGPPMAWAPLGRFDPIDATAWQPGDVADPAGIGRRRARRPATVTGGRSRLNHSYAATV